MPFILTLIGPFIPYILGAIAIAVVYFGLQRKGANKERAKIQAEVEKVKARVEVAESKDEAIDEKVRKQIDAIKKTQEQPTDSDGRFHF